MPWRETSVMEERLRFVARLLEGEGMSEVCRDFGISRKTGYKIFNRYKDDGLEALTDRSRRPVRYANQLPDAIETHDRHGQEEQAALGCQQDQGAAGQASLPAMCGSGHKHGACGSRSAWPRNPCPQAETATRRKARPFQPSPVSQRSVVRRLQGRVQARQRSDTVTRLTVTDQASRYLLACEAFESTREAGCSGCLSPAVCRARPAGGDPHRQWPAVCRHPTASTICRSCPSGG
jgi:transposase-like protein